MMINVTFSTRPETAPSYTSEDRGLTRLLPERFDSTSRSQCRPIVDLGPELSVPADFEVFDIGPPPAA